jgi:hypothetical protein
MQQQMIAPDTYVEIQGKFIEIYNRDSKSSLLWFWHEDNTLLPNLAIGGEISNDTGFLPSHSFPLPLSCSLPFSLSVLGG